MQSIGKKLFELDLYVDRFPKGIISKEIKIINIEDNTNLNDLFSYSNIIRSKNLNDYKPPINKLETESAEETK